MGGVWLGAWSSLVLRSALCLNLLGYEVAVRCHPAFDQRLGTGLKGVGQWVTADVADRELPALLFEDKVHAAVQMGYRPRANVSRHAHALVKRGAPECRELGNSV